MNTNETRIERFTGWFQQRPTSIAFWELLVTDRRLIWCFVGESFKALLLRADTGERGRAQIDDKTPQQALSLNEQNYAVSLDSLRSIHLREGTWLRRARLSVTLDDHGDTTTVTLYGTQSSDSHRDIVRELGEKPALSHVDITVEPTGLI